MVAERQFLHAALFAAALVGLKRFQISFPQPFEHADFAIGVDQRGPLRVELGRSLGKFADQTLALAPQAGSIKIARDATTNVDRPR